MSERVAYTTPGPSFIRADDGKVQFQFINDPRSVIGPRPATSQDQANHPGAWRDFIASENIDVFDRDAQGGPGGSLPATVPAPVPAAEGGLTDADLLEAMTEAELRDFIKSKSKTGTAPHHKAGMKTLLAAAHALVA